MKTRTGVRSGWCHARAAAWSHDRCVKPGCPCSCHVVIPVPVVPVIANELPYSSREENPLRALQSTLSFSVDDWGESRAMAWTWGIVNGWDDEDGDDESAFPELAARFDWSPEQVVYLRRLHAEFVRLSEVTA